MLRSTSAFAAVTYLLICPHIASARPITLDEALAAAESSPTLTSAATSSDEAEGNLVQADTYRYNPAIIASAGPAFGTDETFFDYEVGVGQQIELGGKRGARRRAAAAQRDAVRASVEATRNTIFTDVRRVFAIALLAEARVLVTSDNEDASRELRAAAEERLRLGAATQTEVNVAVAGVGRAIAARRAAERELLNARAALGQLLGLPGADLLPKGPMPTFSKLTISDDELVAEALAGRRDLTSAERVVTARAADVDVADAQAVPDPELSVTWVRSEVEETNALVVGLRVDLPLWNRNQGNRHAARAIRKRAQIEAVAMRAAVDREVRTAAKRYRGATETVAAFDQQVVGTLAENLKLARETLAAGKLGLLEVNVVRRDLVDSQLAYLDSIAEAVEARAALETALGRSLEGR